MIVASAAIGFSSSSPPKMNANWRMLAIIVIVAATMAAIDVTRMSWFFTCASSWASTPRIWSSGMERVRPSVTATAACFALRPVANAFGWSEGTV